jgi:hypothetical protein
MWMIFPLGGSHMRTKALILGIASLALMGAAEPSVTLTCKSTSATVCDQAQCRTVDPSITVYAGTFVDRNGKRDSYYSRCDDRGCDSYTPRVAFSGAFVLFALPSHGVMAKVGPSNEITDVATLMQTVYINRATCVSEPPPLIRTTNHKD